MVAAHDASDHAADAGLAIEETTLVQLHANVSRASHAYAATPPGAMFAQLYRARDLTYRMLERTRRPSQTSDLYLIAGQISVLMAGASYDLGHPEAASEQAMAALTYGQVVDHPALRASARASLSMIAFWSGRPGDGLTHARAGLEHVTDGENAVRLHALAGRCAALSGSATDALESVRAADQIRQHDQHRDELADDVGGEFAFGPARHSLCVAATHLALGDTKSAAHHARAALALYETGPQEQRAVGGIHGARVDLGIAHAMGGDLDASLEAVAPTLRLQPEHRTHRLITRLRRLHDRLTSPRYQGSTQAEHLKDHIEEFLASTTSAAVRR
jgi:hypothetical protein